MARVLRVTANLKEAISKTEVLTDRNLIKGLFSGGNRAMDWERPKFNRNSKE
jgi:hypothetical protein